MDKNDIKTLLESYRMNKARLGYNAINRDDIIESMVLQATTIKDMPVSATNKFNSSTENAALNIQQEEQQHRKELIRCAREIYEVEQMLDGLAVKERFIIETKYILGFNWQEVKQQYMRLFEVETLDDRNFYRFIHKIFRKMIFISQ